MTDRLELKQALQTNGRRTGDSRNHVGDGGKSRAVGCSKNQCKLGEMPPVSHTHFRPLPQVVPSSPKVPRASY